MNLPPGGDAILFVLPQSRWHYAVPCTIHSLNSQPIFMAIMLTLTLIAIGLCFFYHSWLPTFLVIEIAVLLPAYFIYAAFSDYNIVKKYGGMLRTDKNGLYYVARDGQGRYTDSIGWPWRDIRLIWFYKRSITIGIIDTEGNTIDFVLPTDNPGRCRNHLLHHWWLAAHGMVPEMQPYLYSTEERAAMEEFIAARFGQPDTIVHDKYFTNVRIDIAVIKPSEERPYYTLCTIGAGAYPMQVPYKEYIDGEMENRAEYIVYLPPEWNVTGKGHWRKENDWPADYLRVFAQEPELHSTVSLAGRTLRFDEPPTPSTEAMGMAYAHPLPDLQQPTRTDLPTGYSIGFLQMVFTNKWETRLLQTIELHGDNILKVLFRNGGMPEATSPEGRAREYAEALLRHFRQIAPPTEEFPG